MNVLQNLAWKLLQKHVNSFVTRTKMFKNRTIIRIFLIKSRKLFSLKHWWILQCEFLQSKVKKWANKFWAKNTKRQFLIFLMTINSWLIQSFNDSKISNFNCPMKKKNCKISSFIKVITHQKKQNIIRAPFLPLVCESLQNQFDFMSLFITESFWCSIHITNIPMIKKPSDEHILMCLPQLLFMQKELPYFFFIVHW